MERSGRIDKEGKLPLDHPLTVTDKQVKVIVLIAEEEEELAEHEWQQALKNNKAFDFLSDLTEDIYSMSDRKALHDEA